MEKTPEEIVKKMYLQHKFCKSRVLQLVNKYKQRLANRPDSGDTQRTLDLQYCKLKFLEELNKKNQL
jgi:hypothetical protein